MAKAKITNQTLKDGEVVTSENADAQNANNANGIIGIGLSLLIGAGIGVVAGEAVYQVTNHVNSTHQTP